MLFDESHEPCPFCNETIHIPIDPGGGNNQEFYIDCEVCCQPILVKVSKSEFSDGYSVILERS